MPVKPNAGFKQMIRKAVADSMQEGGLWLAGKIKVTINTPGKESRADQKAGKRKKARYTPSKPGEPPHRDTGRLVKSMTAETAIEGGAVVTRVGTNVEYARSLEFGTRTTKPRPFMRPGLAENRVPLSTVVVLGFERRMKSPAK